MVAAAAAINTEAAGKKQTNVSKPSLDASLEEAKRNAAAALSRPVRIGNANKTSIKRIIILSNNPL